MLFADEPLEGRVVILKCRVRNAVSCAKDEFEQFEGSAHRARVARSKRPGIPRREHQGDVALGGRDVGKALAADVAVRCAAESEVVGAAPAGEVVAALVTGLRPVRDLVPVEAGRFEPVVDDFVAGQLDVVVGVACGSREGAVPASTVRA